jgi:flagellar biosynthesis protein FliR
MTTLPRPNPAASARRAAKLYRIAGCLWAVGGFANAITGHSSRVAVALALCAVFLALGASKARKAAALEAAKDESPKPSN